jgi:hypothetical protein
LQTVTAKKIPTKQELLQLQKLYRTDKRIGQALGNVSEQLVAYWRRKKGVGKSIFPKYSQREISELWERFGDDQRSGQELGITKQAFYRWRKKYKIFGQPAILRLEQLELKFFDEQRLNRSGEKVWPAQTFLQKVVSYHNSGEYPVIGQQATVPIDLMVSISDQGIRVKSPKMAGVAKSDKNPIELYESFTDMFDGGHFRANRVIVGDRPEVAVLAATSSYVRIMASPIGIFEHQSDSIDIEVAPSLKVVLSSATPVRHNTFDTACRISEAIAELSEKSFIIELSGPGAEGLPIEDRMSLIGYLSFLSGRNAVIEPDQTFLNCLNRYGGTEAPVPYSDKNAPLFDTKPLTLAKLRSPIYSLSAKKIVSDPQEVNSKQLHRLRIGPLLGGSVDDFRQLAQSLRGDMIKKGLQLYIIPSSQGIFAEALRRRYVHAIVEAGGRVGNVIGTPHLPTLQPNEFELTTELNPAESDTYLASIQTIIQSLRTGKINRRAFE